MLFCFFNQVACVAIPGKHVSDEWCESNCRGGKHPACQKSSGVHQQCICEDISQGTKLLSLFIYWNNSFKSNDWNHTHFYLNLLIACKKEGELCAADRIGLLHCCKEGLICDVDPTGQGYCRIQGKLWIQDIAS